MIANDILPVIQTTPSPTLEGLFRRVLARQPDALALIDPVNKPRVTGQAPKRLTFAQADRAISALSAHFIDSGLPANSVIAVHLPNTVEFMLTVLAAHRAGLIVALLPQLWRQAELTVALNRTGARAIVTTSRIDGVNHADLAMNAAAELFSIRHVCGFGDDLPEGMASLDHALAHPTDTTRAFIQDGRKAAMISFDVTADGFRAVPRTHLNLIAGGLAVFLESNVPQGARMMSAFAPSSFAGLTSSLLVWLLSGGTLALHQPFDADVFEQQISDDGCDTLVAPAQLALRLSENDMASRLPSLRHVIGLWRAPEQIAARTPWTVPQATLTDVYLFGEAGLFGARRGADGAPAPILPGPHGAPRDVAGLLGRRRNPDHAQGHAGPARTDGDDRGLCAAGARQRLADLARRRATMSIPNMPHGSTARPARSSSPRRPRAPWRSAAIVSWRRTCRNGPRRLGQGALLTALPDRLSGYRLAGRAQDNARAREALAELGLNPLMVEAFRDRAGAI